MKLFELKSSTEVKELEAQLDKMFSTLGLDVEFSRHFIERLLGREKKVTKEEIVTAFSELKRKYKNKLKSAKKKEDYEAILQDLSHSLNIVFSIEPNKDKKDGDPSHDLVNITIKQKDPEEFHANVKGGEKLKVGRKEK